MAPEMSATWPAARIASMPAASAPPGDLHQALRLGRDAPDGHGHGRVAVVAMVADAEVEPHDVPLAQRPLARGHAVHHLVVDRDADRGGEGAAPDPVAP